MHSETRALALLKRFYGYDSFYPIQWQIISHTLDGGDSVVLMPTGGGKSLCFQMPALMMKGCVIVVSPLLALMNDQVDALKANGIPAAAVNSQQTDDFNREVIENVFAGHIKLLYISPEKLLAEMDTWSHEMRISLIAIDEAHCISQWGHDFRPEYTRLSTLRERFDGVPIMALTATADRLTRDDIRRQLNIPDARMFITSFDRPNIRLQVLNNVTGQLKFNTIVRFITRHKDESGIIYCLKRKSTEDMARRLKQVGIVAEAFHAGMGHCERIAVQRRFITDETPVICATIAFGMGIDKSNVRWVIHSNMPKSIECYYQEVGRAGRDGMPAEALLFYSYSDVVTLSGFAQESGQPRINFERLKAMQQFAESHVCRRRILLSYFGERYERDCGNCDVCSNPPERFDGSRLAQMALSAIARTNEQTGMMTVVDILRASNKTDIVKAGYNRLPTYGVGREVGFREWNAYLLQMLQLGLIEVAYDEGNHLHLTDYGREVLYGRTHIDLVKPVFTLGKTVKPIQRAIFTDGEADPELFQQLKDLRLALARARHIAPYMVFSDKTLNEMARVKPTTKAEFSTVSGVGQAKLDAFWRPFVDVVKRHMEKLNSPKV